MTDLQSNLRYLLKKHHLGKEKAVTIRDLCYELLPIYTNDREIRLAIRELNLKGVPILSSTNPPFGFYYAQTQSEIEEYKANLVSRLTSLKERIEAIDHILIEPKQLRLFI